MLCIYMSYALKYAILFRSSVLQYTEHYKETLQLINTYDRDFSGLANIFNEDIMPFYNLDTPKMIHDMHQNTSLEYVRTVDDFHTNFEEILKGFIGCNHTYMKHVVIAGGSIVRALQKNCNLRASFGELDVDIFLIDCTSSIQRMNVTYWIMDKLSYYKTVYVTANAYTCVSDKCRVQVMRRTYKRYTQTFSNINVYTLNIYFMVSSPQDVINSFDIDCCCVLYHNMNILANTRGLLALKTRMNVLPSITCGSTLKRFVKYSQRGMNVVRNVRL